MPNSPLNRNRKRITRQLDVSEGIYARELSPMLISTFTIVYRPNHQLQSDADALEDARREAMGLPPLQRYRRERVENATDDQVYERFKKRSVSL